MLKKSVIHKLFKTIKSNDVYFLLCSQPPWLHSDKKPHTGGTGQRWGRACQPVLSITHFQPVIASRQPVVTCNQPLRYATHFQPVVACSQPRLYATHFQSVIACSQPPLYSTHFQLVVACSQPPLYATHFQPVVACSQPPLYATHFQPVVTSATQSQSSRGWCPERCLWWVVVIMWKGSHWIC